MEMKKTSVDSKLCQRCRGYGWLKAEGEAGELQCPECGGTGWPKEE